jgi:murein DD-endopeptidase MepM/ murein hydrolase activator NlpD
MKGRRVTILIVPDSEGTPHTLKLSVLTLKVGLVSAILALIIFLAISFTWGGFYRRAQVADRLELENEQFRADYQRVAELEERLLQLNRLENQIRRALGADLDFDDESWASVLPSSSFFDTPLQVPVNGPSGRDVRPVQVRSTLGQNGAPRIYHDADIPSLWPVEGFISRGFERNDVIPTRSHTAVDIAGKEGEVIKATAGGIVVWCGWSARYGNLVILAHPSGYFSVYGHNQLVLVEAWQRVERGVPIALLGNTGQSSAPHLHFEIWYGNQPLDPQDLLTTS